MKCVGVLLAEVRFGISLGTCLGSNGSMLRGVGVIEHIHKGRAINSYIYTGWV